MRESRQISVAQARVEVAAEPRQISVLRHEAAAFASAAGVEDGVVDDVRTAVSEAATNAVLHAYCDGSRKLVRLELEARRDVLLVRVRDWGRGADGMPAGSRKGVGLRVMATLCDRFQMRRCSEGGTEVRMAFAVRRSGAEKI